MDDAQEDRTLEGHEDQAHLDPAFTNQTVSRIRTRVVMRDLLMLILEGFAAITVGLFQMMSNDDKSKPGKKRSRI